MAAMKEIDSYQGEGDEGAADALSHRSGPG